MDPRLEEITKRLEALEGKAADLLQELEADPSKADDLKAVIENDIKPAIEELTKEKKEREQEIAQKAMQTQIGSLQDELKRLKTPSDLLGGVHVKSSPDSPYGGDTQNSFYADVKAANRGNQSALERMSKALGHEDVKAMTEGTDSAGGYLVNPQISDELIQLRLQGSVLRPLFSSIQVNSDTLQIASITGGLTSGWVAELASKPAADMTFGQLSVSVFTAAGLAVTSNQLLQDSRPGIDGLINQELARRLAILEEVAFIDGSGTGQPLGILGTSGVNAVSLTSTAIVDLLDAIYDAISAIQTNYFGEPNAIVMHPRTWARITKARESGTSNAYLIGSGANSGGRVASDGLPGRSLFGFPVYLTNNIPTNKGGGTESRVIVGNFQEGLVLDHSGIAVDESQHVYFTTNQTVFRAEERVGFTAARYPKAFSVIGGAGLAGG